MKKQALPVNLKRLTTRFINYFIWIILTSLMTMSCNTVKENNVQKKNPNGRNDTWGFAGYGGGGAMFYPAVSPHDADYVYVAFDMTGSFVT